VSPRPQPKTRRQRRAAARLVLADLKKTNPALLRALAAAKKTPLAAVCALAALLLCGCDDDSATRITDKDIARAHQEAHESESDAIGGGYGNAGR
jgi:hypothetical protein